MSAGSILVTKDGQLAAVYRKNGGCVLGVAETDNPSEAVFEDADAVVMSYGAVTEAFLRLTACHRYLVPYQVAVTRRLILRESIPEDYPAIRQMLASCPADVFSDGMTLDEIGDRERFVSYTKSAYAFFGYGLWTVTRQGEVIGWCGLFPVSSSSDDAFAVEMGYLIREDMRNQGYAQEACRAILSYAGEEIGVKGVCLHIPESNQASLRLAQKLGFVPKDAGDPQPGGQQAGSGAAGKVMTGYSLPEQENGKKPQERVLRFEIYL